ncbi:uncharacterized protein B0H64DRAFT_216363 [Chaetomium fimeti]|uniref:Uncharacterized protein n=1 Tax=Chaetomium fimeti TaxID=1854472 RepID=A0AAE0LQX3_9PEZI|nr:hypothetical protein B0H64DRAFT_216363 [Chaetomium fimeti]
MMHRLIRSRYRLLLLALVALLLRLYLRISLFSIRQRSPAYSESPTQEPNHNQLPPPISDWDISGWEPPVAVYREKVYKPAAAPVYPAIDPFPVLSKNPRPTRDVLVAPSINRPPQEHYPEQTPLFVGFTRNWPQLLQCVVSYIAAGWPAEDIYVVENTGVMYANRDGKLTLQNPFYLNHTQLAMLGVGVIVTPTLLTFSQLQNFYLWTALERQYPYFFWSHQDLLVFSLEPNITATGETNNLYTNAVTTLRHLTSGPAHHNTTNNNNPRTTQPSWAHHFFAYDHLTLVNRDAVLSLGGWDTHIPFYASDCDAYLRARWAGLAQTQSTIGLVLDVGEVMADLGALLRLEGSVARLAGDEEEEEGEGEGEELGGPGYVERWEELVALGEWMQREKYAQGNGMRNTWQVRQRGGQGEPFYRDADGFERGVRMMIETGREVFAEKWGHRGCDVEKTGAVGEDAWRLEMDWVEGTDCEDEMGRGVLGSWKGSGSW